jgi:phosphatidylserine decarboxylase
MNKETPMASSPEASISTSLPPIRDRRSRELVDEPTHREADLRWSYEDPVGRVIFDKLINGWLYSAVHGLRQELPGSRAEIPRFVETFGIDMREAERPIEAYRSFNDFFTRRLKPDARPIDADPDVLVSSGDGKLTVYPTLADGVRLPIKGARLPLSALLGSEADASSFLGGAALILRLSPQNYHRFHFPADGTASPTRLFKGRYHSVNPIALAQVPDLYCHNKRTVTFLETPVFGRMALIEVGAITVGRIVQTHSPGPVAKGQEKGYFAYGGSTMVALFEPGALAFDDDLVADSAAGIEVRVRMGERIARALRDPA